MVSHLIVFLFIRSVLHFCQVLTFHLPDLLHKSAVARYTPNNLSSDRMFSLAYLAKLDTLQCIVVTFFLKTSPEAHRYAALELSWDLGTAFFVLKLNDLFAVLKIVMIIFLPTFVREYVFLLLSLLNFF